MKVSPTAHKLCSILREYARVATLGQAYTRLESAGDARIRQGNELVLWHRWNYLARIMLDWRLSAWQNSGQIPSTIARCSPSCPSQVCCFRCGKMGHFPSNCALYLAKMKAIEEQSQWMDSRRPSVTLHEKRSQVEYEAVIAGAGSGAKGFVASTVAVGLLNKFHAGFRGTSVPALTNLWILGYFSTQWYEHHVSKQYT